MAFVRKQKRGNQFYYYLVESRRDGNKVKQINLQYLGNQKPSREKIDIILKQIKLKQMENIL